MKMFTAGTTLVVLSAIGLCIVLSPVVPAHLLRSPVFFVSLFLLAVGFFCQILALGVLRRRLNFQEEVLKKYLETSSELEASKKQPLVA